jgi:hypothetical protein
VNRRPIPRALRRGGLLLAALGLGALLRLLLPPAAPPSAPRDPEPPVLPVDATPPAPHEEPRLYLGPGSPWAAELHAAHHPPERDVQILHRLTGTLLSALKGSARPPLGLNEDFARALRGENRLHLVLLPAGHPAFAADGRLVDRWGTPYHFHPVSSDWVEIRSAGPDRRLFTGDDLLHPPPKIAR